MNDQTRRRVRPANILFGLLFLAVAGAWATWTTNRIDGDDLGRLLAGLLIVLGVAGVAATVALGRRRPRADHPDDTLVVQATDTEEDR